MASKILKGNLLECIARVKTAFIAGVDAVQPHKLITSHLQQENNNLIINGVQHHLQNNVYVIGFGKAVAGMIQPLVTLLRTPDNVSHLQQGIISVPVGFQNFVSNNCYAPQIEIFEGAKDNIPDEAAFMTAKKIISLVESLKEHHLLLVLISGGGSALLPYPLPSITLQEKTELIKSVSRAGASITELNTLRKALSCTKGGRLAKLTDATIVSFILSDIINSPLDMIASGPTVPNRDPPDAALKVLEKYDIFISEKIRTICEREASNSSEFSHVTNLIIGNNETALMAVETSLSQQTGGDCLPLILSSSLQGEASEVGKKLANFAAIIMGLLSGHGDQEFHDSLLEELCVDNGEKSGILSTLARSQSLGSPVCFIFGGETTVTVTGVGQGGRNQEMVLAASITLEEKLKDSGLRGEVIFLSGGTDGIDGPTDAAGAITFWSSHHSPIRSQVQEARDEGLSPATFLSANDSYSYFSRLSSGQYLLQPGHTGTNVMDLQILFINPP